MAPILIKVYADWRNPTLTIAEMQVIVEEAPKAQRKVAPPQRHDLGGYTQCSHGPEQIRSTHGHRARPSGARMMKSKGVYLVPTLSVIDAMVAKSPDEWTSDKDRAFLESMRQSVAIAKEIGVKIADGSDPAATDRHGKNAEELEAMTRRGLKPLDAIRAATTSAADLIGWPDDVGAGRGRKVCRFDCGAGRPDRRHHYPATRQIVIERRTNHQERPTGRLEMNTPRKPFVVTARCPS